MPQTQWFMDTKALLGVYWKDTPWQREGDRVTLRLGEGLRTYAKYFRELQSNLVPMTMDQYLAALWHGEKPSIDRDFPLDLDVESREARLRFGQKPWRYRVFEVAEDLGENRFRCVDEEGGGFPLFSPGIEKCREEGSRVFLSLLLEVGEGWWMSYGPLFAWRGLLTGDLSFFAAHVARQRFAAEGIDGVIRFDPLPFWALWYYANQPLVVHRNEALASCWLRGRLEADFGAGLPSIWKRQDVGKRSRWIQGRDYFMQKAIYVNRQTDAALLYAHSPKDLLKLVELAGPSFCPAAEGPEGCGVLMEAAIKELLGVEPEIVAWERPFARFN